MNPEKNFKNIDEYIEGFPRNVQTKLKMLRQAIREAAPQAQEVISYRMPAFKQNGTLVYFAAFENHIGFYPTASGVNAFKEKLSPYQTSKGAIRFPFEQPIPLDLIKEIVKFRVGENLRKIE